MQASQGMHARWVQLQRQVKRGSASENWVKFVPMIGSESNCQRVVVHRSEGHILERSQAYLLGERLAVEGQGSSV